LAGDHTQITNKAKVRGYARGRGTLRLLDDKWVSVEMLTMG